MQQKLTVNQKQEQVFTQVQRQSLEILEMSNGQQFLWEQIEGEGYTGTERKHLRRLFSGHGVSFSAGGKTAGDFAMQPGTGDEIPKDSADAGACGHRSGRSSGKPDLAGRKSRKIRSDTGTADPVSPGSDCPQRFWSCLSGERDNQKETGRIPCCDQIPESAADAGNFEKERGNPPGGSGSEGVEG